MAKGKGILQSKRFKVLMSRVYGLGAAVVIIGALFKIIHLHGADIMLIVGLCTEAFIFAVSAFEPVKEEIDWTLVYPELAGMEPKGGKGKEEKKSLTQQLDKMLEEAQIEQSMVNRLGDGLRSLTENVSKMSTASDAAVATNEYAERAKEAANTMATLNQAYSNAISSVEELGKTGEVSQEYYAQVNSVTQKMSSLNAIYEMELNESNNHMRQLNTFFGQLSRTVENLSDSESAANQLRDQFNKLNQNLNSLNTVYGNMLSAMSTPRV
jgi:gliding motility-associated protein GldL